MPKNYNLRKLMLELLDKRELSKLELFDETRKKSEILTSDKTLNESLMSLLKENEIYITGYDFNVYNGVKRIQSLRTEGLVFGRVKLDFVEVDAITKKLESSNTDEVKDASYKLKTIFKMRMEKLEARGILLAELSVDDLFNRIIYYINSQNPDQTRLLLKKLAWGLCDEKGSIEIFKSLINYIQSTV
jgi:hypothetical protein